MTNSEACKAMCTAAASMFYPDEASVSLALSFQGLDPSAQSAPKDPAVLKAAIALLYGFVESSRSEGGVSASLRSEDALRRSLSFWCRACGLDPEQELKGFGSSISNRSNLW